MTEILNDTILNMVKNLKPTTNIQKSNVDYNPLKRSISSSNSNESCSEEITPMKKSRQGRNLDISYIGSPREVRRLRCDLLEARNTILSLETRISRLHSMRKEMQLLFDEENQGLKRQKEYNLKTIEELETQVQTIRKRECDLKNELAQLNNKYDLLKIKSGEEIEKLERSLEDFKEESRQIESEENGAIPSLERKIESLQTMLEAAEADAEAQKKLAVELEKRLSENNAVQRELDIKEQALQKAKLYIKELEYAKDNFLEYQEQAKTQAHKLAHYIELQKENEELREENVHLKEEVRNKLILEEEVYGLKSRLVKFKEHEKQLADLQVQETQNAMYLNEWRAVARGICESVEPDSALPHTLRTIVERLQQQELSLTSEKVELESQLKSVTHDFKIAKTELEKIQKLDKELKIASEQKQNIIHRMEKKLLLVRRERDSYRLQLDSYERDLTMCANTSTTSGVTNQLQSQKERIENLEKIISGYRDMTTKLETDLLNAQPALQSDIVPARAEQITRLQNELQQLKNENMRLRDKKDELEIQLESYLIGNDTLKGGQVFHVINNPLSECIAQRENQYEKEIEKLKKKIKSLEEGIEMSKLVDTTMSSKELETLKEQLKSQETQAQMLKEYFKSQMQEFRNVIYMLLGYKIDRTQNSLYKLRSMYAEKPDDQLCFQVNKDGDLSLLENEFSATLGDMIDLHLKQQKSIPVFLSAITLDLFSSKTITKTMQID